MQRDDRRFSRVATERNVSGRPASVPGYGCECVTSCTSDADCGVGAFCLPPEVGTVNDRSFPQCFSATCTEDSDCASGECALFHRPGPCGGGASLSCREAGDCRTNGDCDTHYCSADDQGWSCNEGFDC